MRLKDKKEVFIDKKYKLPEELNNQKDFIKKLWKNRTKSKNIDIWEWQYVAAPFYHFCRGSSESTIIFSSKSQLNN